MMAQFQLPLDRAIAGSVDRALAAGDTTSSSVLRRIRCDLWRRWNDATKSRDLRRKRAIEATLALLREQRHLIERYVWSRSLRETRHP